MALMFSGCTNRHTEAAVTGNSRTADETESHEEGTTGSRSVSEKLAKESTFHKTPNSS